MKQSLITAIDIGTATTRIVVAQERDEGEFPYIIAAAEASSIGLRRGSVIEPHDVAKGVVEVIKKAELQCGENIDSAIFSVGGRHISARISSGIVVVGRADGEIVEDDVERVLMATQAINVPANKEIIHVLPRQYSIDDQSGIKDPIGMKGVRLEMEAMIFDAPVRYINGIESAAQHAEIEVEDIVVSSIASVDAVLSRQQKELGVVLINIGASTTSIVVYEENELIHIQTLPIGAGHVTNDIAIGLRTAIDTAEAVKLHYGAAMTAVIDRREECDLSAVDSREEGSVSRYHLVEIIQARMEEIFSLVQKDLEKIGKAGLLPAGAIIIGGGSKLPYTVNLAKEILRLPVRIGDPIRMPGIFDSVDDPAFVTALGLIHWATNNETHGTSSNTSDIMKKSTGAIVQPLKNAKKRVFSLFEKFFP